MAEQLPEGTDTIIEGAGVSDDEPGSIGTSATGTGTASAGSKLGLDGSFFERIESFRTQGYDKAREYAEAGKEKTTSALDDLMQTINDAAGQIDSKIGAQYGDYARKASDSLGTFNEALKGKDVDQLFADARAMIAKAPAVAIGTAAVLGFVIARLAKAGIDESKSTTKA